MNGSENTGLFQRGHLMNINGVCLLLTVTVIMEVTLLFKGINQHVCLSGVFIVIVAMRQNTTKLRIKCSHSS